MASHFKPQWFDTSDDSSFLWLMAPDTLTVDFYFFHRPNSYHFTLNSMLLKHQLFPGVFHFVFMGSEDETMIY